ncbi:MAG: GNAT family N-acetyltransferase [Planctomycetota bacterium]|jgi:ribosomal protein S18 acetylase RimI-like enzyme
MERRPIDDRDRPAIAEFIERHWHSKLVMSRGESYYPHEEDGFIEWRDEKIVGLLTLRYDSESMELLTLNSTLEGQGIGSALMLLAIEKARELDLTGIWLTTTNDNLRAVGFYQRLGFRIVSVNIGAVDAARRIKPQIPEVGRDGIPIHDEIVLELTIKPAIEAQPR